MKNMSLWFEARMVPAKNDSSFSALCDGDILGSVAHDFRVLRRCTAALQSGAGAVSLLSYLPPTSGSGHSRLRLFVRTDANDAETATAIQHLVERGIVRMFYGLHPCAAPDLSLPAFQFSCDVVRFGQAVTPTVAAHENWRVPSVLYEDRPFVPNEGNDYLEVDRLTYAFEGPLLIHFCVEPYDAGKTRQGMARYCAELLESNRGYEADTTDFQKYEVVDGIKIQGSNRPIRLQQKREPLVDEVMRNMQRRRQDLSGPQVLFQCRTLGVDECSVRQMAATVAECAFREGTYDLVVLRRGEESFERALRSCAEGRVSTVPTVLTACASQEPRLYEPLLPTAQMASPEELSGLITLPVGSSATTSLRGPRKSTDPPEHPETELIMVGHEFSVGKTDILGPPRGFKITDVCKGVCSLMMPGFGKTVGLVNIAFQCHQKGIPFIFIAPIAGEELGVKLAKNHSDPQIRRFAEDTHVYTPGRDDVSPMALNPVDRFPWVPLDQHVEEFMACCRGSVETFPAMESVLQESLYELYRDFTDPAKPPRMSDLIERFFPVLERKGYEGDVAGNVRAAADVRLRPMCRGSLGRIFESGINCPDIKELLNSYTIIALDALPENEKAKFILFLLKMIREYISAEPRIDRPVRLVIIIDEAHLIAGAETKTTPSEEA